MAFGADRRREYLRRLRERALERVREEERAAGAAAGTGRTVSRRQSLRWLGLAAVAAGARPLRVLAETPPGPAGVMRERAAMVGSMRLAAPQYGVPGFPEPTVPFEPTGIEKSRSNVKVFTASNREELGAPENWVQDYAVLLPADGKTTTGFSSGRTEARVIAYNVPSGKKQSLEAISDSRTAMIYIAPGGHDFYVEDKGELWGFVFAGHFLTIRKSYLTLRGDQGTFGEAIRTFASSVSDATLRKDEKNPPKIDLGFEVERGGGWGFIMSARAADGVAFMSVRVAGQGQPRDIQVDWKKAMLL